MAMKRSVSVELAIEQVTVEGVGPQNGFALKLALQRELARLVRERGVPQGWDHERSGQVIDIPSLQWDGRGGETGLAAALAGELYKEFDR
jgi:hypothetical protein